MIGSIAIAGNGDIYVGTGSEFDWAGGEGGLVSEVAESGTLTTTAILSQC